MVQIEPFQVEEWMDKHETKAEYNIAETCAASISISDLVSLSERTDTPIPIPTTTKLTYGSIRGSDALRNNISALYSARSPSHPLSKENILITPGAIAANFLVLYTLLSPGDHVICHYPTYSQLWQVPRSLGASVSLWKADPTKSWALDLPTLKSLIRPSGPGCTKLLILNNPNNPTGSVIPKATLESILSLAAENSITVLVDEVYRPLFHSLAPSDPSFPASALNTAPTSYPNVIVTSSLSKSYSLAGLRVGWLATRSSSLLGRCAAARHYTTISVSPLDDSVAALALSDSCVHALLARNIALARTNLGLLEAFVDEFSWACEWVRPVAGTTAFVRFFKGERREAVDEVVFCERLMERKGVLIVPGGTCFGDGSGEGEGDFKGYVRIGFVSSTEVAGAALEEMRRFMREEFEGVPVWRGRGIGG